jgi:hypothetical protein
MSHGRYKPFADAGDEVFELSRLHVKCKISFTIPHWYVCTPRLPTEEQPSGPCTCTPQPPSSRSPIPQVAPRWLSHSAPRSPVKPSLSHNHNPPASFGILAGACRRSAGSHPHTARILSSKASISALRIHSSRRLPRVVLSVIRPHFMFPSAKSPPYKAAASQANNPDSYAHEESTNRHLVCVCVYRSGEGGEDLCCLRICVLSWATVCGVLVGSVETNG